MYDGVVPRYDLPRAAPEPLRLVQRFVNSVDDGHGREWLPDSEALDALVAQHSPGAARAGDEDLRLALELRGQLRALLRVNNGAVPDDDAVEAVNRAAGGVRLRVGDDGVLRVTPGERPVDRVLAVAFEAMLDGSWARLKACRQCGWAFWDPSRNRSGTWCSMQICGNRLKTRAYRRRRSGA